MRQGEARPRDPVGDGRRGKRCEMAGVARPNENLPQAACLRWFSFDPSLARYQATQLPDLSAQRLLVARRRDREELGRVARSTPARRPHRPDRAHRRRGRSDRYAFPASTARRAPRCRCAIAQRERRRNPDPVRADTAAAHRAGDHDADRWHRPICDRETRGAADQAADQGAPVQHDTRRRRQRALCRVGRAGGCELVLISRGSSASAISPRTSPRRSSTGVSRAI